MTATGTSSARTWFDHGLTGRLFATTAAPMDVGGPPVRRVEAVNLATNLLRSAELFPERPAVRLDDTILTYAALADASSHAAGLSREHGVGPGDRVAIMLPNVCEFAVI